MNCPVCQNRLYVKEMHGVIVDICDEHGVWLDRGELEKVHDRAKEIGFSNGFVDSLSHKYH